MVIIYHQLFKKEKFTNPGFDSNGNLVVPGNLFVKGGAQIDKTLGVYGNTQFHKPVACYKALDVHKTLTAFNDVVIKGGTQINKTLGVYGKSTFHGKVNAPGFNNLNKDMESIRNLSDLANQLTKNGKLVVPGGLQIKGSLSVNGDTFLNRNSQVKGSLSVNGDTFLKNSQIKGSLGVYGNTQFHKPVACYKALDVHKTLTAVNDVIVKGGAQINKTLGVYGNTQFHKPVAIYQGLDVHKTFTGYNDVIVKGGAQINKSIGVYGNINGYKNLNIIGRAGTGTNDFLKHGDGIKIWGGSGYLTRTMTGSGSHPSQFKGWSYFRRYDDNDSKLTVYKSR